MISNQLELPGAAFEKPLTERQKASEAKSKAQVRRAALKVANKLDAAVDAMEDYLFACRSAGLPVRDGDDGREILIRDMRSLAGFLEGKYGKTEVNNG